MAERANFISLKGVRQNNLKGFDLDVPLGHLVVVTGLSGAGKSSLVFETIHAEGQRRYVETFSPYTRQFLELLDRPQVDQIDNIRPSIAIEQRNTVKTSRSTVGTMTELTDFFKIWFAHVAELFDPETGERIKDDNPQSIWLDAIHGFEKQEVLVTFKITRPDNLSWKEIYESLIAQGYSRILPGEGAPPIRLTENLAGPEGDAVYVIQDRIKLNRNQRGRFIESIETALHFGQGVIQLFAMDGSPLAIFSEGLHSPSTGKTFAPSSPALFSFNSPVGACPHCRGFGRVIEIDYRLVVPDHTKSLEEGAIKAFTGSVYSESLRDCIRACKAKGIPTHIPWADMAEEAIEFIMEGEADYQEGEWTHKWYGVRRFFDWLETQTYKMHVRVFLSKYRAYVSCPHCGGTRLQPEALNWRWKGYRLPDLYLLPISDLLHLIEKGNPGSQSKAATPGRNGVQHQLDLALEAILTRLRYLEQVGLGYLTLDRSSRTLSGGETMRVNLTGCLGTSLVDTLFVLDEPSVGLHARDIDRLIGILKRLTSLGNTVVVVEHDEEIMKAADTLLEIGPYPGNGGGQLTFNGTLKQLLKKKGSLTGDYLAGRKSIAIPDSRRRVAEISPYKGKGSPENRAGGSSSREANPRSSIHFYGASKHNIKDLDISVPLNRLVAISGVSGSGKSTLLNNVIYQGLLNLRGRQTEDPAMIREIDQPHGFSEIVLVDQAPISRTPRSNPALFTEAWDPIRERFAATDQAKAQGMTHAHFSFNSGEGRCPTCSGLGYERVEMQFLSDVFVECPTCHGQRFRPEVLEIKWQDFTIADILGMDVNRALEVFQKEPRIQARLQALQDVGLGYLQLGQPLNTLSGGESQRLKLVKYLSRFAHTEDQALLLLDEPTTGLHREDVRRLIQVLQQLVDHGHSVLVIEHQMDVLAAADWLIEMGPEAGSKGGKLVAAGTPETIAKKKTETGPYLKELLTENLKSEIRADGSDTGNPKSETTVKEASAPFGNGNRSSDANALRVIGAREHNLKDISVNIPHGKLTVVTGVSGSGKSSLAFDIIFAEGQRRFMESMSSYARQFVEQMPKPDIDALLGIAPTVAIEQRVTRGSRKSTVATITEVAQYLRLLYARVGVQHHPRTGKAVLPMTDPQIQNRLKEVLARKNLARAKHLYLFAPLIRGRKGHHQPLANWAIDHGYQFLRCDGVLTPLSNFQKLDRYKEHDIELLVADLGSQPMQAYDSQKKRQRVDPAAAMKTALRLGKGSCFLMTPDGTIQAWFSKTKTDPETGDSFPELDPKHFSWNSSKGWCPTCRGHGRIYDWMKDREDMPEDIDDVDHGSLCPDCGGERLNEISRAVRLPLRGGQSISLPELLAQHPRSLLKTLSKMKLDARGRQIADDIIPQISERLQFMDKVGIEYLTLDRATNTLSGGEAQRIRLAAQLGSNLAGVLYVLDEPSIGLHARDNDRLIQSMTELRDKGNTLLVVEHDDDTMRAADHIIDMGPGAGLHGGEVLAKGPVDQVLTNKNSLTAQYLKTGIPHPLRGKYRQLPAPYKAGSRAKTNDQWLLLQNASLRNLQGETLQLPLNRLIMVCGVSGAGKSTLIRDCMKPAIEGAIQNQAKRLKGTALVRDGHYFLEDLENGQPPLDQIVNGNGFKQVIEVDQSPIGKTPRSTPSTYIGAYNIIRDLFASLPEAKMRGMNSGTFSFNTKGGRCEKCKGAGRIKLEMAFLPDTYINCDACNGLRYGPELDDIRWKGKNIGEVLNMSFEEAADFFDFHSHLKAMLNLMVETGLGYLNLGQSSPTLSGGEAQRLKLVSELAKGLQTYTERSRGIRPRNLYILEEPTIGLHLRDCERLIELLHRLVDQGHTVIVIEHHLDLIAEADYVVEVGPGGGDKGGRILYQGKVSGLLKRKSSPTAPYLKDKLIS